MGDQAIIALAEKRATVQKQKDDCDTRVTQGTAQQSALAALIADYDDGITDLGGAAPDNTVVPAITGTAKVGQTLTASHGTFTGAPVPSYGYQWQAAGVNIPGAVGSTYVPVTGDIGKTIRVVVTGTNILGSDTANSVATSAVIA